MKDAMIDAVEEVTLFGVLDNLENEAEYMENVNDEEEYAKGMRYVIETMREWYVRQNFMANVIFRGDAKL